jgi:hypothetical protein
MLNFYKLYVMVMNVYSLKIMIYGIWKQMFKNVYFINKSLYQ